LPYFEVGKGRWNVVRGRKFQQCVVTRSTAKRLVADELRPDEGGNLPHRGGRAEKLHDMLTG
jgi:hypothetical protein